MGIHNVAAISTPDISIKDISKENIRVAFIVQLPFRLRVGHLYRARYDLESKTEICFRNKLALRARITGPPSAMNILILTICKSSKAAVLVFFCLLMGCPSFGRLQLPMDQRLVGYSNEYFIGTVSEEDTLAMAKRNWTILSEYKEERPYRSGREVPQKCLALSGGGVRSAFYSLGVMKALNEFELLNKFDLISAVSGGSYAAGWYFYNLPYLPFIEKYVDSLFDDRYVSPLLAPSYEWLPTLLQFVVRAPIELTYSVLRIAPFNLGPYYKDALLKSYARHRMREHHDQYSDELTPGLSRGYIEELGKYVRSHHLPGFIFNMTIQDRDSNSLSAHGNIYEVTTWGMGSEFLGYDLFDDLARKNRGNGYLAGKGYLSYMEEVNAYLSIVGAISGFELHSILDVMAISGAATAAPIQGCFVQSMFDSCVLKKIWSYIRLHSNLTLGLVTTQREIVSRDGTLENAYFFLSDGGHSENLGAYSLIRRHCKDIIIVDAEQDTDYVFEGYIVLRSLVRNMLGGILRVDPIDDHLLRDQHCSSQTDLQINCSTRVQQWDIPIMKGKVVGIPILYQGSIDSELDVTYLKLSIDRSDMTTGADQIKRMCPSGIASPRTYYSESVVRQARTDRDFPMYQTEDQWLRRDQKKALMDLGYAHMKAAICSGTIVQ